MAKRTVNLKRKGVFDIQRRLIKEDPEAVLAIFKWMDLIVFRAEVLFHNDLVEYWGISKLFREIEDYEEIPRYMLEIQSNTDGSIDQIVAIERND